jgi:hypothetical protein
MIHEKVAEKYAASNRDMILEFYRNIGISAVAAALEATSRKPQGPMPSRKDVPAIQAAPGRLAPTRNLRVILRADGDLFGTARLRSLEHLFRLFES